MSEALCTPGTGGDNIALVELGTTAQQARWWKRSCEWDSAAD